MAEKSLITKIKKYNSVEEYPIGVDSENVIVTMENKKISLKTIINYITNFFKNAHLVYSGPGPGGSNNPEPKNPQIKIWLDTQIHEVHEA